MSDLETKSGAELLVKESVILPTATIILKDEDDFLSQIIIGKLTVKAKDDTFYEDDVTWFSRNIVYNVRTELVYQPELRNQAISESCLRERRLIEALDDAEISIYDGIPTVEELEQIFFDGVDTPMNKKLKITKKYRKFMDEAYKLRG